MVIPHHWPWQVSLAHEVPGLYDVMTTLAQASLSMPITPNSLYAFCPLRPLTITLHAYNTSRPFAPCPLCLILITPYACYALFLFCPMPMSMPILLYGHYVSCPLCPIYIISHAQQAPMLIMLHVFTSHHYFAPCQLCPTPVGNMPHAPCSLNPMLIMPHAHYSTYPMPILAHAYNVFIISNAHCASTPIRLMLTMSHCYFAHDNSQCASHSMPVVLNRGPHGPLGFM